MRTSAWRRSRRRRSRALVSACILSAGLLAVPASVGAGKSPDREKLRVVCTVPTLRAIARAVGGEERFDYVALARPDQDPHYVSPTPSLMRKVRDAVLLLEVGMQLEIWADQVADGSGNPRVFRGGPGRVRVSVGIPVEEVPAVITRAAGHIHPEGNPHVWLDPVRAKDIAASIGAALARVRPDEAEAIQDRLRSFQDRIDRSLYGGELVRLVGSRKLDRLVLDGDLWRFLEETELAGEPLTRKLGGWLKKAESLRGVPAVESHKTWVYFAKTFGLDLVGTLEEKPGIPPGPRHQREIAERIRARNVRVILVDNFYNPALARRVADGTGAEVVVLPTQVGGEPDTDDYFRLIDHLVTNLVRVADHGS